MTDKEYAVAVRDAVCALRDAVVAARNAGLNVTVPPAANVYFDNGTVPGNPVAWVVSRIL